MNLSLDQVILRLVRKEKGTIYEDDHNQDVNCLSILYSELYKGSGKMGNATVKNQLQ